MRDTIRSRRVRHGLLLGGIVALALGFRVWGISWGLHDATVSRRAHPDEWPIYWLFQWFDSTHSLNPCSTASRCFFDWGMVFPYFSYAAHALAAPVLSLLPAHVWGATADPVYAGSVLSGRLISLLASTATVLAVYRLGSSAYGGAAGLLAASLVALSGLLIQLAHFATPDSTTVLLATLSLLAAVLAVHEPSARHFALAGLAAGLAAGCEYHMVLLAFPVVVVWLLVPARRTTWLAISAASALVALLTSNIYALVDLPSFVAASLHTLDIRTVGQQLQYQGRFDAYGPAILYVIRYPLGYGASAGVAAWMIFGAVWAGIRRQKSDLILLAWTLPYFLLVTWSPAKFMRYSAPLFPALAVFGARLAIDALHAPARVVRLTATALAALALLFAGMNDAAYAGLFTRPLAQDVAVHWLQQHAPPASSVGLESLPTGLINLPYFVSAADFRPCILEFEPQRLGGPAQYVLTDRFSLEEHPRVSNARVDGFRHELASSAGYHVVLRIHETPTFLGLSFPIDASPHDWRYPARTVTIYRHIGPRGKGASYCFDSIARATAALYRAHGVAAASRSASVHVSQSHTLKNPTQ